LSNEGRHDERESLMASRASSCSAEEQGVLRDKCLGWILISVVLSVVLTVLANLLLYLLSGPDVGI
jgi:hypothetical protein